VSLVSQGSRTGPPLRLERPAGPAADAAGPRPCGTSRLAGTDQALRWAFALAAQAAHLASQLGVDFLGREKGVWLLLCLEPACSLSAGSIDDC
jgi:hypothetical protein